MIEGSEGGRRVSLAYGMVGGGEGSFIGDVHRKSIAMDGLAQIKAGCFSQNYENTLSTGEMLGLDKARCYKTFNDMMAAEKEREDKIDFVIIVTPNSSHYAAARAAIEAGIHVVCDKPLATNSREAEELARAAAENFCSVSPTPIPAIPS